MTRPGSIVEGDVSHRRLLALASDSRPLERAILFDSIGGQATVDRLVDGLYDRFDADPVIRSLFGTDLTSSRARQKRFFAEWLWGSQRLQRVSVGRPVSAP